MPRPSRSPEMRAAAAKVFLEKGYHGATLDDVAREAGVWKGSLYHYFGSKEELLLAIVRDPAEKLLAELRRTAAVDLPPAEKVRLMIRQHVTVLEETFVYAAVYLQELAGRGHSVEFAQMDHDYITLIDSIVAEGIEAGVFDADLEPRLVTFALVGALNWLVRWFDPHGARPARDVADRFSDIFLKGLLSRSASNHPTVATTAGNEAEPSSIPA